MQHTDNLPRLYPVRCCEELLCWIRKGAIVTCPYCGEGQMVELGEGENIAKEA